MINNKLTILDDPDEDGLHRNSDVPQGEHVTSGGLNTRTEPSGMRDAAVLIPLVRQADDWHILFIRRAQDQRDRHSGQVAFPGGSQEPGDSSLQATALREAQEEVGLSADRIKVLGQLEPYITISDFRVTPVVGIVQWPSTLNLQSSEVARAFLMPLPWLRDRQNFTFRARSDMDQHSARRHPIIVFNEYDGETLWGATARMTVNFIRAIDEEAILLPVQ